MAKTRAQLVNLIADKLGIVGAGQSLDSEDYDKIDASLDNVFAQLSADEVFEVADPNDIDDAAFQWIGDYGAFVNAPTFSKQQNPAALEYAEKRLRRIGASSPTGETLVVNYF